MLESLVQSGELAGNPDALGQLALQQRLVEKFSNFF